MEVSDVWQERMSSATDPELNTSLYLQPVKPPIQLAPQLPGSVQAEQELESVGDKGHIAMYHSSVDQQSDTTSEDCSPVRRTKTDLSRISLFSTYLSDHSFYHSGEARPIMRGVLHFAVTPWLAIGAISFSVAILIEILPDLYWRFVMFLLAKTSSYGVSSCLHLYPFKTKGTENICWKIDVFCISVSIWGTTCPFVDSMFEWLVFSSSALAGAIVVYICIAIQAKSRSLFSMMLLVRYTVILSLFAWSVYSVGRATKFPPLWGVGAGIYLLSFIIFASKNSLPPALWHRLEFTSYHEDFHTLVFAADVMYARIGLQFLADWPDRQHTSSSLGSG